MIVVAESWPLIYAIRDNFISEGFDIEIKGCSGILSRLKIYGRIAIRPVVFIYKNLLDYAAARDRREKPSVLNDSDIKRRETIVMRTWVGEKYFSKDGIFTDAYFNWLTDWLSRLGHKVMLLPILVDTQMPIKKIMPFLRKPENRFLIPWDYLRLVDIFKSILKGMGQLRLRFGRTVFRGWDIKGLLVEERLKYALSNRGLTCILQYYLLERLSNASVKIDRFIYTFENMLSEKLFIAGARKFYGNAMVIGFQHSVLYPLHLTLYISEKEADITPLPDKIVCSGEFFKEILQKEGYPAGVLDVGPALRFKYLFDQKDVKSKDEGRNVLVVLPGYKAEAVELLIRVLTALKNYDIKICIKPHPLTDISVVERIIGSIGISPEKISVENGVLSAMMNRSDLMIALASSVIFDAIASGIPVLRIKRETDLDLDPADWLEPNSERDFIAYSYDDIRAEVGRALSLGSQKRRELVDYGKRFVEANFSPVNDATLSVFLS